MSGSLEPPAALFSESSRRRASILRAESIVPEVDEDLRTEVVRMRTLRMARSGGRRISASPSTLISQGCLVDIVALVVCGLRS